ncbi:hypothetical protein ON010_g4902 [Phytophthora cinnamomi]|nr:hypothetical protein ON010_g4902 [Phytophthora cinnamomi]
MHLPYILMAAVSTLSVHQVPVTASVGSDVALTGAMSLVFLHFVSADQSVSDHTRFLRCNNIDEGDEEERGFADMVEVKNFVKKMLRTNSFSDLEKAEELAKINKISDAADDQFADNANMRPDDLAIHLKTFPEVVDDFMKQADEKYTNYLRGLGKVN